MVAVICNRKMLTPGLHIDETWFSDPLFCKESKGIDFVRIGRNDAVHEEVQGHCFSAMDIHNIEDIKVRLDQIKVVAVTCLGITSPLLVNKRFDVCIMDEAGQTTLPSTESLENGMGVSLFCRLSEAHPQAISALQNQIALWFL